MQIEKQVIPEDYNSEKSSQRPIVSPPATNQISGTTASTLSNVGGDNSCRSSISKQTIKKDRDDFCTLCWGFLLECSDILVCRDTSKSSTCCESILTCECMSWL